MPDTPLPAADPGGLAPARRPLAVVVLAAGHGTRMRSDRHKVLHPLAGRPLLLHLLDSVAALDPARIVVVVGARREQVAAAVGARATIAVQAEQRGTADAVRAAAAALADFVGDVLVVFGDAPLVTTATLRRLLAALTADVATAVLGFRPAVAGAYGRIVAEADGTIAKMVEFNDASAAERAVGLCNSGVIAAASADLWPLLARVGNANAAGEFYLPDIVGLAARPSRVIEAAAWEVAGVNSRGELAELEAAWQARTRAAMMASGVTLVDPGTVWFAHDTVVGRDVTIEPNVVFGPGVRVGDGATIRAFCHLSGATIGAGAEVGPFARLRPGAELGAAAKVGNFVEIKAATIGAGAKVSHLSYVGDAAVGARANLGAGTITCNYDGFFKHRTTIGVGAFIGSNSALVAPLTIGDEAIVGAGSVVTADVAPGALALARGVQSERPGWAIRFQAAMRARKAARD